MIIIALCLYPTFLQARDLMTFSTIQNSPYATISENVMRIAYSRLETDILILDLPAERAILTSNLGEADGELYRIKNVQLKYKNLLMIPEPIGKLEGVAITWNKNISMVSWDELSSQKVCFRRGVKFAEIGLSNMKALSVDSNKQLFELLKKKRCDVIIIARITSIPMVIDYIKTQKAQLYQSVLQTYPLFHYIHKKNAHLTENLNNTLKNMRKEGLMDEIRSQFIATKSREASTN
jgi:hypothetical protein